jgi:CDP-6-deoxy-D-xylo-4-hexulose-3-dehydrase
MTNKEWFYPTAFSKWDDEEYAAIDRVQESGRYTMGEEVAAFEREFADYHGMQHGIMVNSGSSANLIMIACLAFRGMIKRGDKVVVPALAWPTTYASLVQYGLKLILSDCDDTWNATFDTTDTDTLTGSVRLAVGCSILGNPAYLSPHQDVAEYSGTILIEDNCESLGAFTKDGKRCGTHGLMNSFSFFYSHQISAIEGGMILTDDEECAHVCRMLRNHGWVRDPKAVFEKEYDFKGFGYNVRPLELHAAIAREQLKKLDGFIAARKKNLEAFYKRCFWDAGAIEFPKANGSISPFGIPFLVKDAETRQKLVNAFRAADIDCRPPTGGSFTKHPYGYPYRKQKTPFADAIHERGLFIGNAPYDIEDKIACAIDVMKDVL